MAKGSIGGDTSVTELSAQVVHAPQRRCYSEWTRRIDVISYGLLLVFGYVVAPTALVWGWTRWIKQKPRLWTISSSLSFVGFLLASASAVFALSMVGCALAGGFEHTPNMSGYSPNFSLFFRWMQRGEVLSLLALAFALSGVVRQSATRWQAPASAVGTLAFWLIATTWP